MPADPVAALRMAGQKLTPALRQQLIALGPEAVGPLIAVLKDRVGEWAPLNAVDLLVELRATEAIVPMLELLEQLEVDDLLHSRIVTRLPILGSAVLEPALAMLAGERERGEDADDDLLSGLCEILGKLGIKDERIFEALCSDLENGEPWAAASLAVYGDSRALPPLERAIEEFDHEPETILEEVELGDLLDAFDALGGALRPDLRERVDDWFGRRAERRRRATVQRAAAKLGRNEPCHCGSGKKYKKCCLDADQAARPRLTEPDAAGGRGPARQMLDYARPLIDVTDGSEEEIEKAVDIGALFWNLALMRDEAKREEMLRDMFRDVDASERGAFESTARMMIDRHRAMFPEMH